jgi:ankyrin repeat protein
MCRSVLPSRLVGSDITTGICKRDPTCCILVALILFTLLTLRPRKMGEFLNRDTAIHSKLSCLVALVRERSLPVTALYVLSMPISIAAMAAFKRSQISCLLVLSSLLLASNSVRAQEQLGTVKSAPLTVYAEMSKDSDVVTTLAPGESVQITFSVTSADGVWCEVAKADSSEKLGFVLCNGLDRQNDSSAAPAGSGAALSAPVYQSSINATPSRAQKNWAIAATAMLAIINHEGVDTLSSGGSVIGVRSLLQNSWDISNRDQLLNTLGWIDQGGHRQLFSALGARTVNLSPDELRAAVSQLSSEDANSVMVAHRYYEKYTAQSLAGWDYARYISLCRWGVAAGYITEEEAWPRVMHAAQIIQQTFTSWSELGENYLIGREFWSLSQTKIDGQAMRAIYERLLRDPGSPWNRIPWDLPLEPSSSAIQKSPSTPSVNSSAANGPCEALQQAATNGQISDAESVLEAEPDLVDCRDSRGWTPLHYAAFNGETKAIQILVAHGAAVNATDKDGAAPLHAAATSGYPDAIELLLESGARIDALDRYGDTPLQDAASAGSVSATEVLLRHHAAIEKRCSNGFTPLQSAAFSGHADVVRSLLEHGADIESRDKEGYTPLNRAAWSEQTEVVALLLEANANANTRSNDGATPLHGAATKGSVEIATLLIEHGAHVNVGNAHGFTPLHEAADNDRIEVANLLIAHDAEINARTDAGDTPLHWAAYDNRMNAATLLLQDGAEVNAKDKDGNTPLHWAAARGHVDMTELLIAHGADIKAKTRSGCTPLRGAYDYHQTATAEALLRHGGTR